jgi:hypothetical protein
VGDGDNDTPPTPFPAVRARLSGDPTAIDAYEWRRELQSQMREMRREQTDAISRIEQRLSGIETMLRDGAVVMSGHGAQLRALVDKDADHESRITRLEASDRDRKVVEGVAEKQASKTPPWWVQNIVTIVASIVISALTIFLIKGIALHVDKVAP